MSSHMIRGRLVIIHGGCIHNKRWHLDNLERVPWPVGTHHDEWCLNGLPCGECGG